MRWPAAWAFAAVCAVGCHSTSPSLDPFLPRTRIPPPPTGAATGSGDAYYTSPAPPFNSSAPAYPPPAAAVPGGAGGSPYTPPGGFQYNSSPTPAGGSGMGTTPGPVRGAASQFVPPVGGRSADRGVVLAAHQEASQYGETLNTAATKVRRKSPVVRASHNVAADDEPTVYERKASATRTDVADSASAGAVDLMDLPAVVPASR